MSSNVNPPVDPDLPTQPLGDDQDPLGHYQPIRVPRPSVPPAGAVPPPAWPENQAPGEYPYRSTPPPPPPLNWQPPQQQPPYTPPPQTYAPQPAQHSAPPPQYAAQPPRSVPRQRSIPPPHAPTQPPRRRSGCWGCLTLPLLAFLALVIYLIFPWRDTFLLLGIDRSPEGTALGRSDTMILVSVNPLRPDVAMLSIPRDLWVAIPGYGENRINTAHFFAEAEQPGSGPAAAMQVVSDNFGVPVSQYARIRLEGFPGLIDAMGGVTVNLENDMGGLPAGEHHLDGEQALAFARDRKGTDDFFRMKQGQVILLAAVRQTLSPLNWPRLPAVFAASAQLVDTNIPVWNWPRMGVALVRATLTGSIDNRTLDREMVTPFTTDGGAQVLGPNWEAILPMVDEMFR